MIASLIVKTGSPDKTALQTMIGEPLLLFWLELAAINLSASAHLSGKALCNADALFDEKLLLHKNLWRLESNIFVNDTVQSSGP